MGRCQKYWNLTFKVKFLRQKSSKSCCFFFEEYEFRSISFVIDIFLITSILKPLYFLKWCPIFDSSPLLQFSKFNNLIWLPLIFSQKNSNFVSLPWKPYNRYCHTLYYHYFLWFCNYSASFCYKSENWISDPIWSYLILTWLDLQAKRHPDMSRFTKLDILTKRRS